MDWIKRRQFLIGLGSAVLLPLLSHGAAAVAQLRRVRPSDSAWPSQEAWRSLNRAVGGNLFAVKSSLDAAKLVSSDLKNPYAIGDDPALTQTLGWLDAWTTRPSVYGVAARNANDIAAAVTFARTHNLRLVVKGAGHSYLGTSNAPDSLLIWTRHMHDIQLHDAFVAQGCDARPQAAVTVGAGTIGMQAYQAVTTQAGKYVQGGGCTTVGLAGLLQGGGFGSFSKHYGLVAASLLEAEVVTAEGAVRIANACSNPDLFWALKGGGGGTFGVISRMTLKLHDLPTSFGIASFKVKASSDDAYRRLIIEFMRFYRTHLFNDHWGEQARFAPTNTLEIAMNAYDVDSADAKRIWQPFLDWVARSPNDYSLDGRVILAGMPARHWWDPAWWGVHWPEVAFPNTNVFMGALDYTLAHVMPQPVFAFDTRSNAPTNNAWWKGSTDEAGEFLWAYESLWLPKSLLNDERHLGDAIFAASRQFGFSLHFNKGLAGAPPEAIAAARDTCVNPQVLDAFALVIAADGQGPAYPGVDGHRPDAKGHISRTRIASCMTVLRGLVAEPGSYFNETNYFEPNWQRSFWGPNYPRLAAIKKKYDPDGLFYVHHGVGSEEWSSDGFARL